MEIYWSTFRHGLSANVRSPQEEMEEEEEALESYWPTDSTGLWDMELESESEGSGQQDIDFRRKSATYNVPIRRDQSKEDINVKEERFTVREEMKKERTGTRIITSDSYESITSSGSFKSDLSKEEIIYFKERLSPLRFPLKHTASTGSICFSNEGDHCKESPDWLGYSLPMESYSSPFGHEFSNIVLSPSFP